MAVSTLSGPPLVLLALRVSTLIWWANFLLTTRWAHVPGSIHGPKEPWFAAALIALTVTVWWPRGPVANVPLITPRAAAGVAGLGAGLLAAAFLIWFPWSTWTQIPFLDDWAPRFQSTREFIQWFDAGWLSGWQWYFLGGYHTSSDVTQSLGFLGYLPMRLFGDAVGFHVLHACLFAAVPWLLTRDLALGGVDRATRLMAAAAGSVLAANYSYFLLRSGDTNSLAGAVLTLAALTAAHAARTGRVWGGPALVTALVAVAYAHAGSFVYAVVYLLLDAAVARDGKAALRAVWCAGVAQAAALPMTIESWRYPELFHFNNVHLTPPAAIDWPSLIRKIGYNIELLWLPGRWFNDYGGLALVLLPVIVALVVVERGRVRFYAAAALLTVGLMRLNDPHFGYAFIRPIHMFAIFLAPIAAITITKYARSTPAAWALTATCALFVQIWWQPVPHVSSVRDFNAPLVDRVAAAPGALVLVENNPHRNTNATSGGRTAPSKFGNHFESLLAAETGRRLYASYWDGWQWSPWRGQMLGGGTWMGQAIADVPQDTFHAELDRWGIVSLFVWSEESRRYVAADARYRQTWTDGTWTEFRRDEADGREVVVPNGVATLEALSVGGATVRLTGVRRGDPVVVRTNFHPSWTAELGGTPVPLRESGGQLAFDAPCDGACDVALVYPRRAWLRYLAVAIWLAGMIAVTQRRRLGRT